MKQYIDKAALVAEIDKWKEDARKGLSDYAEGVYDTYEKILLFLDTLEVKEVDLEGISKNYALNNSPWDDCMLEMQNAFKDGFELGLKVQKGEEE